MQTALNFRNLNPLTPIAPLIVTKQMTYRPINSHGMTYRPINSHH